MPPFEIGIVLPIMQFGPDRETARWPDLRAMALRAEAIGFDTIWTPDELLWRMEDGPPRGVWEGVAMAGRGGGGDLPDEGRDLGHVRPSSQRRDHRQGGRGARRDQRRAVRLRPRGGPRVASPARRSGSRSATSSPASRRHSRSSSRSSGVVMPTSRARGTPPATCRSSPWVRARTRSRSSSAATVPKGQPAAARHADIYSCYVEARAVVDEVAPRLASLDATCAEIFRDPATIGRSVGVSVRPLDPAGLRPDVISGSAGEIADAVRAFREAGFSQLEMMVGPGTMAAFDALAPVVEQLQAD